MPSRSSPTRCRRKLTIFNGGSQIFVYVFPDLGPTFVTVGKIIHKKDGPFDYTLDFTIPPIKTLPSAPDASVGTVDTNTPKKIIKKGKKKLALIVTPKKCKGTWKAEGDFHFATGELVKNRSARSARSKHSVKTDARQI